MPVKNPISSQCIHVFFMAANVHGSQRTTARNAVSVKHMPGTVRLKFKQQKERKNGTQQSKKKQFLYLRSPGKHFTWPLRLTLGKLSCRILLCVCLCLQVLGHSSDNNAGMNRTDYH